MKQNRNMRTKTMHRSFGMHTFLAAAVVVALILMMTVLFTGRQAKAGNLDTDESVNKYYTSYQVQRGDTLWTIAEQYNIGSAQSTQAYVEEVCRINHLSDGNHICAGNKICIPYYQSSID